MLFQIDMVEVKDQYQKHCLTTLADDIREHYSKDVKNILLAVINGKWVLSYCTIILRGTLHDCGLSHNLLLFKYVTG